MHRATKAKRQRNKGHNSLCPYKRKVEARRAVSSCTILIGKLVVEMVN